MLPCMSQLAPVESPPPAKPVSTDPRVLQANERTLLAWVRTSLALIGFGFLIAKVGLSDGQRLFGAPAFWLAGGFALIGTLGNVLALRGYLVMRRAHLKGEAARPDGFGVPVFVGVITALGLGLTAWVLTN